MLAAEQNDLKPSIGCTIFLIARWVLLDDVVQVLCTPQFVSAPESARMFLIAAVLAPLLSILIFSGTPLRSMARSRNRRPAETSRLAVSRKSTVSPSRSTARYRYFHRPPTWT